MITLEVPLVCKVMALIHGNDDDDNDGDDEDEKDYDLASTLTAF